MLQVLMRLEQRVPCTAAGPDLEPQAAQSLVLLCPEKLHHRELHIPHSNADCSSVTNSQDSKACPWQFLQLPPPPPPPP